ncbi:SDR family NAD(P)-dependent oxidoreductase, partial [Mycobacterium kiyosense]
MTAPLDRTAALVTGASSGIGAAVAKALAAQGAAVALLARRADRLAAVRAEIESAGGTAISVPADVTDAEQVAAAVDQVVGEFGRLDIVVNNAGLMQSGPAATAPLRDWEDMVSVNVAGVLYVTRAALPHLVAAAADSPRGVADLVNISSTAGWVAR